NTLENNNNIIGGMSKYAFNKRFRSGEKVIENRFFAETVHVRMNAWRDAYEPSSLVIPQIIALIPENIANTSNESSENIFIPITAYYKGVNGNGKFMFEDEVY